MIKASIWKDKIVLRWSGPIPADIPRAAIQNEQDLVYFWPHLTGFAKWNEKFSAYLMNLSFQNIERVRMQFGDVIQMPYDLQAFDTFFKKMREMSKKVKELPFDTLPKYDYKMQPLGEYQHRGVVFLCNVRRAPLFADCGVGKTYMVLASTAIQLQKGLLKPGETLVCGKLATLKSGWLEDCEKFTDLKAINLWLPQSKNRKEKILELINTPADLYIINHDGLRLFEAELAAKRFKKVVVDESTILKGFHGTHKLIKGGQFGRALMNVAAHAEYRVIMSGTPAPNGIQDLWGQFYFLDPDGILLGSNFNDFRETYMDLIDMRPKDQRFKTLSDGSCVPRPLGPKDPRIWEQKKDAADKIGNIINPIAYRVRLRDHIKDFPDLTIMKRDVDMTPDQAKHYKTMEKELKVLINDARITVPIKLTQIMKLRQITGGYIIDQEEKVHEISPNPKINTLDELLDEIGDTKVVIYAQYRHEIETIERRYKAQGIVSVYGGNSPEKNLTNIDRFRKDEAVRYIVLHPKSAAHGVTFTMSHYMVFYSIDYSAEDNYQCVKRIDRAGQKHPMFVYYLLCSKSIDQVVYKAILEKNKKQEQLLSQQDVDSDILNLWDKEDTDDTDRKGKAFL